jgi:hypothetical protein
MYGLDTPTNSVKGIMNPSTGARQRVRHASSASTRVSDAVAAAWPLGQL